MSDGKPENKTGLINSAMDKPGSLPDYSKTLLAMAEYLSKLPSPITNQWYLNKKVVLDGYTFVKCRFDQCDIYVSSGNFKLDHCYFAQCRFFYTGHALKITKLHNLSAALGNLAVGTINTHEDGTCSITD